MGKLYNLFWGLEIGLNFELVNTRVDKIRRKWTISDHAKLG